MRKRKLTAGLLTSSLLVAASAIAGNTTKGTLNVDETVTVAGKQLPAGRYQVEWTGNGPTVELTISSGRDTVAKVPAQILPVKTAQTGSGYSTNTHQPVNNTLTGIFFGGKKYELSIGEASAATPSHKTQCNN